MEMNGKLIKDEMINENDEEGTFIGNMKY